MNKKLGVAWLFGVLGIWGCVHMLVVGIGYKMHMLPFMIPFMYGVGPMPNEEILFQYFDRYCDHAMTISWASMVICALVSLVSFAYIYFRTKESKAKK